MKPLTIEQLKSLEVCDWVWVIDRNNVGLYIRKSNSTDMAFHSMDENNARYGGRLYSDYGKTWLAYKNKEQAEAKGEIVELPCKIKLNIGSNTEVWQIVYMDDTKYIHTDVVYTNSKAEAKLAELKGEK